MDKALKQRLLGAAVVTALVVIVVPELVREPAQPVQGQSLLENNSRPMPVDDGEPTADDGSVVERVVISLPGQENLREPGVPLDQPQSTPMPAVQVPALPQTPRLAGADLMSDDEGQPLAGVAAVMSDPLGDFQTIPDGVSPEAENPMQLGGPDEPEPVVARSTPPPLSNARQQAAVEAAEKLRRHEIQRNRRIALARAEMADERQRDAETLAAQRERATREAQARQQTAQRQTAARGAEQRVAASPPARQGSSAALPPVDLIARPEAGSGGSTRWTVQVGSFSRADYANQQRDRLVAEEFPAVVRPATVNGQTLFRVQVGLQDSRNASEQMRLRVRQQLGISSAAVMPLDG